VKIEAKATHHDFEASGYTEQGPFLKLRIKADQETFTDISTAFLLPSKKGEAQLP
jgi:hypothetical protein